MKAYVLLLTCCTAALALEPVVPELDAGTAQPIAEAVPRQVILGGSASLLVPRGESATIDGPALVLGERAAIDNAKRLKAAEAEAAALRSSHLDGRVVFGIALGALLAGAAAGVAIGVAATGRGP